MANFDYMFSLDEVDELMQNFDIMREQTFYCAVCEANTKITGDVFMCHNKEKGKYLCHEHHKEIQKTHFYEDYNIKYMGHTDNIKWNKNAPIYNNQK